MSSRSNAKRAQDKRPQQEQIATASPPQDNALVAATMGAIVGAVMGYATGCCAYDFTYWLNPHWTSYQSLPLLNLYILSHTLSAIRDLIQFKRPPFTWSIPPAVGAVTVSSILAIFGWRVGYVAPERHIAGPQVIAPYKLPQPPPGQALGIWIGPVRLTKREEVRNILLVASPSGGKTTVINTIMDQIADRGDQFFAIDLKGDYRKRFPNAAYIAPWTERSVRWRVGHDVRTLGAAVDFAFAFIPFEETEGNGGEGSIWPKAAREVVVGVILYLIDTKGTEWGLSDIAKAFRALAGKPDEIAKLIEPYRPLMGARLPLMAPETRESVYFNILPPAQILLDLADLEAKHPKRYWSVADWISGRQPFAILGWRESEREMTKRLALPMVGMIVQALISDEHPEQPPEAPGYWIVVDEAGNLGTIPSFARAWSTIRSKGGRLVAGFQNFEQIETLYRGESKKITGAGTRLIGLQTDPDEQEEAEKHAGERVIERYTVTYSASGKSEQWQIDDKAPVYRRHRFARLGLTPNGRGVKFLLLGRDNSRSEILFPIGEGGSK